MGRVLHFGFTMKGEEKVDEAYHLQVLWDGLKTFGFDLSWLDFVEPFLEEKRCLDNFDGAREEFECLKEENRS